MHFPLPALENYFAFGASNIPSGHAEIIPPALHDHTDRRLSTPKNYKLNNFFNVFCYFPVNFLVFFCYDANEINAGIDTSLAIVQPAVGLRPYGVKQ